MSFVDLRIENLESIDLMILIRDMEQEIKWPFPNEDQLIQEHLVLMQRQLQLFVPLMQEQLLILQQPRRQNLERARTLIQQQQLQLDQYRKRFLLYMDYAQQQENKDQRTKDVVQQHFTTLDQYQKRLSYELEYQQTLQQQLLLQLPSPTPVQEQELERTYSLLRDQLFVLEQYQLKLFGMMEQQGQERQLQKQLQMLHEHEFLQQQQTEFVPVMHEQLLLLQRQQFHARQQTQHNRERDRVLSVVDQQLLILRQYQGKLFSVVDQRPELVLLERHQNQIVAIMHEHLLLLQRQQHRQQPQEQERIYSVLQEQLQTLKQCQDKFFPTPQAGSLGMSPSA